MHKELRVIQQSSLSLKERSLTLMAIEILKDLNHLLSNILILELQNTIQQNKFKNMFLKMMLYFSILRIINPKIQKIVSFEDLLNLAIQ